MNSKQILLNIISAIKIMLFLACMFFFILPLYTGREDSIEPLMQMGIVSILAALFLQTEERHIRNQAEK